MVGGAGRLSFYKAIKTSRSFNQGEMQGYLDLVSEKRVAAIAEALGRYIYTNLPTAIEKRKHLGDYRVNPYVVMTSASIMDLDDPERFAHFLANNKLYMGLETSFGKSVESELLRQYPIGAPEESRWEDAWEKIEESESLKGLSKEDKARKRDQSVWREVDKSCITACKRFLLTIKSGPNCINDTQVESMKNAISAHSKTWLESTSKNYEGVDELDYIIGLTYGTEKTTNNKENQILVKLMEHGFVEEDRDTKPGVLIDQETKRIRVYRAIGADFWAIVGSPSHAGSARFVFLEVLLGLAKALADSGERRKVDDLLRRKILELSDAIRDIAFPRTILPRWMERDFSPEELVWLAAAMSSFYDKGI